MRLTVGDSPVPKYIQLRDQLILAIESGDLAEGEQLPTEDSLVNDLKISRNTVRQAIGDLFQRGMVSRERGRGTFVTWIREAPKPRSEEPMKVVGVLVPDIASTDDVYPEIIRGVQDVCREKDYSVLLANTDARLDHMVECMQSFAKMRVYGVIISPVVNPFSSTTTQIRDAMKLHLDSYQFLLDAGIRVVLINRKVPGVNLPCVLCDDELGGYIATRHLLDQGHKRIAAVFPPVYSTVKARELGYRKAMNEARIRVPEGMLQYASLDDPDPVSTMVTSLLALPEPPTAIFAFNDDYASKVFEQLMEKGRRVPEDVALVGYNDCRAALSLPAPLTSVGYPKYEIGQHAAQILLGPSYQPHQDPECVVLSPKLIVRASSVRA